MVKIFISHSEKDQKIASLFVAFLEAAFSLEKDDLRCTSVPGYKLPFNTSIGEQLKLLNHISLKEN